MVRRSVFCLIWCLAIPSGLMAGETPPQSNPPPAGEPASRQREAMGEARDHLLGAMRALGEAGRLTYESQLPVLQEKTEKALQETQRLLRELEQQLQRQDEDDGRRATEPPGQGAPAVPERISPSI